MKMSLSSLLSCRLSCKLDTSWNDSRGLDEGSTVVAMVEVGCRLVDFWIVNLSSSGTGCQTIEICSEKC